MPGHTINNCFKVHGYPPAHKLYGKTQANVTFTCQNASTMEPAQEQIRDRNQVGLTQKQYTQLMALLKSQTSQTHILSTNHVRV